MANTACKSSGYWITVRKTPQIDQLTQINKLNFDGFMQKRCNSIANAMELHLSCIKPSIYATCAIKFVPFKKW